MIEILHYSFFSVFLLTTPFFAKIISISTNQRQYEKVGYWICIIFLMFIAGFRDSTIGNDTHKYLEIFESINLYINSRYEIGFIYLNLLISHICQWPQIVLIVTSIFILYSYGRFIWKYSKYPWLSLFLLFSYNFFPFALSGIRESIALAIILFSYDYLLNKSHVKFIILVLIAFTFHFTAIIFLLGILIRRLKLNLKTVLCIVLGGIICLVCFTGLLSIVILYNESYQSYVDNGVYFGETRMASIIDLIFLITVFVFCVSSKSRKIEKRIFSGNNYDLMLLMNLIAITIYLVSLKFNLLSRLGLYYSIFIIITLPNAIAYKNLLSKQIWIVIVGLMFYLYFLIILILRPEWNQIYPYRSIF